MTSASRPFDLPLAPVLATQGITDERRRCLRRLPQHLRKFVRASAVRVQRRQGVVTQQRLCEAREDIAPHVGRSEHRTPPEADAFDDARLCQHWQHASANDGRFAAAAHAEDQYERASVGRLLAQRMQDVRHCPGSAEEYGRMLELERSQSAERGSLLPDCATLRCGCHAAWKLPLDQSVQVIFQKDLEVARRLEGMESGDQRSFGLVVEPLVDELVELLLLPEPLHQVLFVVEPDGRRRGPAIDEQVRFSIPAKTLHRFFEFELGAGLVSRSVRARELRGKPGAEARPEYCDEDVGVRRLGDLLLKRRRGDERFVLPQDGLEHDPAHVLALQPLDDPARQRALFEDVARRRDEESQRLHGSASSGGASRPIGPVRQQGSRRCTWGDEFRARGANDSCSDLAQCSSRRLKSGSLCISAHPWNDARTRFNGKSRLRTEPRCRATLHECCRASPHALRCALFC